MTTPPVRELIAQAFVLAALISAGLVAFAMGQGPAGYALIGAAVSNTPGLFRSAGGQAAAPFQTPPTKPPPS